MVPMSSLESALQILDLLAPDRPRLRVSEVCRALDMPKSSASRLLRTLSHWGWIDRAEDGSYLAGPRSVPLAGLYQARHGIRQEVEQALDGLVERFAVTGFVSVLSGSGIVLQHVRQGSNPLRYVREEGTRLPAWRTAMGYVLLASLPDSVVAARLGDVPDIDLPRLQTELAAVRQRGVIMAGSVLTAGATTIAAAVTDRHSGEPIALALAFPDAAVDATRRKEMELAILATARRLRKEEADQQGSSAAVT
jgi:IclR family transcriptional regulator, KDG regulon repressor